MTAENVKYKTVSITIYPITRSTGQYWQFKRQDGSQVTRVTLQKARAEAKNYAQATYKGTLDLDTLTPEQIRAIKRMIEADPTCRLVDEFLVWHGKRSPKVKVGFAIDEFLAVKEANRGRSSQNVKTLKIHLNSLKPLKERVIADVSVNDLPTIVGAARTRRNVRAAWITFFRWCVNREYLPHGEKTAPERLERPIVRRKVPVTYSPSELQLLLAAVSEKFLPWIACGAFAGIRTDEIYPLPSGDKSPLDWSDFRWDRKLILIRPETDKNGHGRVVPILPSLRHWLFPVRKQSGPLISCLPSSGNDPETTRIGSLVGGWRPNALRHSFISFRAATEGLAKTAMECGNSESEAKKSYNDSKGPDEASDWFSVGTSKLSKSL